MFTVTSKFEAWTSAFAVFNVIHFAITALHSFNTSRKFFWTLTNFNELASALAEAFEGILKHSVIVLN
jgi:hypothetical protein